MDLIENLSGWKTPLFSLAPSLPLSLSSLAFADAIGASSSNLDSHGQLSCSKTKLKKMGKREIFYLFRNDEKTAFEVLPVLPVL